MEHSISNSIIIHHNVMPLPEVEQSHPEHHQNKSEGLCRGKKFQEKGKLRRKMVALKTFSAGVFYKSNHLPLG